MWLMLGFLFSSAWKCGRLPLWLDRRAGVGWSNECAFGPKAAPSNLSLKIAPFELVLDPLLKEGISLGCDWRLAFLSFPTVIPTDNGRGDISLELVFVFAFWSCKGGLAGISGWMTTKAGPLCGLLFIFVTVAGEGLSWMGRVAPESWVFGIFSAKFCFKGLLETIFPFAFWTFPWLANCCRTFPFGFTPATKNLIPAPLGSVLCFCRRRVCFLLSCSFRANALASRSFRDQSL